MSFRVLMLFALMLSTTGVSDATKAPTTSKLQPKPVVFFNGGVVQDKSMEIINSRKNRESDWNDINRKVFLRLGDITKSIAKHLGACGVVTYYTHEDNIQGFDDVQYYIDPSYDITLRAIAQLNEEYLATK